MKVEEAFSLNKKMLLLVAALLVVAAGAYALWGSFGPGATVKVTEELGAEAALPAYDKEKQHLVMRVRDVEEMRKGLRFFSELMPFIDDPMIQEAMDEAYEDMEVPEGLDPMENLRKMRAGMAYLRFLDSFFAAADEFALLLAGDVAGVSFFTDEGKFAALMSDPQGVLNGASSWTTDLAKEGDEALVVKTQLPSPDDYENATEWEFYVLKRVQGERTQVLLSSSEAGLGRLTRAWSDPSARAAVERHLEQGNYLQYRLDMPTYAGGQTLPIFAELAWEGDGAMTRLDSFVDSPSMIAEAKTSGLEGEAVPLYGRGEAVYLSTIDFAYLFSIGFPGVEDPAGFFLSMMESSAGQKIPPQFAGDVRALLTGSRISTGVFMEKDRMMPSTAYLLIEMNDEAVLNKYFSLASLMLAPTEIEGWERALSTQIDAETTATMALDGKRLLLGLGQPGIYGARAEMPDEMKALPDKGVLFGLYLSPGIFFDETSEVGRTLRSIIDREGPALESLFFDRLNLDAISSVVCVQASPDRSETRIYWKKAE